jgi:3-dehydroquinate dehydratase-2
MTNNVFVLNGPNLNLLGLRETGIYGTDTLADLSSRCRATGEKHGLLVDFRQSNHEGEMVEWIHEARDAAQSIVINAAAYTHTSVAIHDALRAYDGYKVELHISNPHFRESFRHVSYVASAVDSIVAGLGTDAYELVLETLAQILPETAVP